MCQEASCLIVSAYDDSVITHFLIMHKKPVEFFDWLFFFLALNISPFCLSVYIGTTI